MDATEYMMFHNEQQLNNAGKKFFTADEIAFAGKGTDWQELVYKDAPLQNS